MRDSNQADDPFEDLLHALVRAEQEARKWTDRWRTGPVATLAHLLQEQPDHEQLARMSVQLHAITEQQDVLAKQLRALQWQVQVTGNVSRERQSGGDVGGLSGGTYRALCGGCY